LTLTMVESVRLRRLRWRLRGAWQWPAFAVLTVADALLLVRLPFAGEGIDLFGAMIVAGFINVLTVVLLAPLGGLLLRRRRRDLPFMIARDYAGATLLVAVFAGLLIGGLTHRSALRDERADRTAVYVAMHRYVLRAQPQFASGLPYMSTRKLSDDHYRACVDRPGEMPICLFVNTDQAPAGVTRDPAREPNEQTSR
jgi:hypothetical protein